MCLKPIDTFRADLEQARSGGYDPGGEIMVLGIHNGLEWIGVTSLISAATAIECANTQTFGMRFNPKPRTRSINQPGKPGKRRRRRTEVRHLNQSVHFSTAINEQFSSGVDSSAAVPPRGLVKYYGKQVEDTAAHVTFESRSD